MKGKVNDMVIDHEDTVSRAASRMVREKKRALMVMKEGEFEGVVFAGDLVRRNIDNPEKAKIRHFVTKINAVPQDSQIPDMLNSMMINDYRAIPVRDGKGGLRLVSKLDLLGMVKDNTVFKEKKARDVMNFPYSISGDDSLNTARSLMRNLNLSRLPVLGKENSLEGIVDTLGLLRTIRSKRRSSRGEVAGETTKAERISIRSLMNRNPLEVSPDHTLKETISAMLRQDNPTAAVVEDGKAVGIITPRDMLKLIGREVKGVYVTISGLQGEDEFIRSVVDEEVSSEVRKLGKFLPLDSLVLHVDRYHETGKRVKYSVKARLITRKGVFFAGDFSWDVTKAVRGVLQKLEKETIKKKERARLK